MKLPNFCIAGFPKCGSTSLYYYLAEHPDIFLPKQKELHYFSYDILKNMKAGRNDAEVKKNHISNFEDYKRLYNTADDYKAVGEVSPSYANYEQSLLKLKNTLGEELKIIVVLRDPIKRAYSNYLHLLREERETKSFYEALQLEEERKAKGYSDFWYYQFNSSYYEKIKRLKDLFPNVYIITFEEFMNDPENEIQKLYKFFGEGIDDTFVPSNLKTKFNPGGLYEQNFITKFIFKPSRLKTVLKQVIPLNSKMKQLKIKTTSIYKKATPTIDLKSEDFLVAVFKDEVEKLRQEFDVKTEFWNPKFH